MGDAPLLSSSSRRFPLVKTSCSTFCAGAGDVQSFGTTDMSKGWKKVTIAMAFLTFC